MTEQEKEKLTLNAVRCHLTLSDYLRKLGLGREIRPFPQKELFQIYKLMNDLDHEIQLLSQNEAGQRVSMIKTKLLDVYLEEFRMEEEERSRLKGGWDNA